MLKVDTAEKRNRWRNGEWVTAPLSLAFLQVVCPSTQKTYFLRVSPSRQHLVLSPPSQYHLALFDFSPAPSMKSSEPSWPVRSPCSVVRVGSPFHPRQCHPADAQGPPAGTQRASTAQQRTSSLRSLARR